MRCTAYLSPTGGSRCLYQDQRVNQRRQGQLTWPANHGEERLHRLAVRCPESCQGFGCGVSEWGARAATVVQCRIKRKRTR